jgi:hypothetical protein
MPRFSGMEVSRRGMSQRSGAPWEKISLEIVTISQERSRKP